jgi:hypothetical protein
MRNLSLCSLNINDIFSNFAKMQQPIKVGKFADQKNGFNFSEKVKWGLRK